MGEEGGWWLQCCVGRAPLPPPPPAPLVSETPEIRGGTRVLRLQLRPEEEEEENEGKRRRRMRRRTRARWRRRRGKKGGMEEEEGAPRVRSYRVLHGSLPTAPPPPRPTCIPIIIIIISPPFASASSTSSSMLLSSLHLQSPMTVFFGTLALLLVAVQSSFDL